MGAICGAVSGNLEVLDIDDTDLVGTLRETIKALGLIPLIKRLPIVKTPSGGLHIYYRCAEKVEGGKKLAERAITRDHQSFGADSTNQEAPYCEDSKWWIAYLLPVC